MAQWEGIEAEMVGADSQPDSGWGEEQETSQIGRDEAVGRMLGTPPVSFFQSWAWPDPLGSPGSSVVAQAEPSSPGVTAQPPEQYVSLPSPAAAEASLGVPRKPPSFHL